MDSGLLVFQKKTKPGRQLSFTKYKRVKCPPPVACCRKESNQWKRGLGGSTKTTGSSAVAPSPCVGSFILSVASLHRKLICLNSGARLDRVRRSQKNSHSVTLVTHPGHLQIRMPLAHHEGGTADRCCAAMDLLG